MIIVNIKRICRIPVRPKYLSLYKHPCKSLLGLIVLASMLSLNACKEIPTPPEIGKPKDWVELNYTSLAIYKGDGISGSFPTCTKGFSLISDSSTYHCYGLEKAFGEIDFNKYNVVVRELNGVDGYINSYLKIRIWINFSRQEWCIRTSRKSKKSSFTNNSRVGFILKIPKIPGGFKEI